MNSDFPFRRIMIFGLPGSGKTTFSIQLSELTNIPLYHLDRYFFIENWEERDYQEFMDIQKGIVDQEEWILDGNAIRSFETRYKRTELALYFRFNRLLCIWRTIKRIFLQDAYCLDIPPGCKKSVRCKLLKYLWNFHRTVNTSLENLKKKYPNVSLITFQKNSDVKRFIKRYFSKQSY
jgi:adenylate kinase family enzyme